MMPKVMINIEKACPNLLITLVSCHSTRKLLKQPQTFHMFCCLTFFPCAGYTRDTGL